MHGVIIINDGNIDNTDRVGAGLVPAQWSGQPQGLPLRNKNIKPTLGDIIGTFKSITTNEYIYGVKTKNWSPFHKRLWQRNYYENIIRDEESLSRIRKYIKNNPKNWKFDRNNPDCRGNP